MQFYALVHKFKRQNLTNITHNRRKSIIFTPRVLVWIEGADDISLSGLDIKYCNTLTESTCFMYNVLYCLSNYTVCFSSFPQSSIDLNLLPPEGEHTW